MKDLDKKDWQILELLCENSRLSHNQIAKRVALSKNAATYRIKRLIQKKIISGFFTVIDHHLFGLDFYEVLIKLNANKQETQEFIEFIQKNNQVLVLDKLSGEWNFVLEFVCKSSSELSSFISELKGKFSNILDVYELHPILESYKVEQLPIELIKNKPIRTFKEKLNRQKLKIDKKDRQLLLELNKDSSQPLHLLAEKLKLTYETIAARIKKLKAAGIIIKFTAKINLISLGYDVYLLQLDLRNLSRETENKLRDYIINHHQVRYAFMSAASPKIFIYLAAKNTDELDLFMQQIKENFSENIINIKYHLSKEQHKYELFTESMLS
jgi:Lrp/AsnC family leucine-responsive transcriptional regulator